MAPEIFESSAYEFSVDIWSLGILLFELLHGYSPFRGKGIFEIYRNIVTSKIPFSESVNPQAKALILSILQRNPAKRPSLETILDHPYLVGEKPSSSQFQLQMPASKLLSSPKQKYNSSKGEKPVSKADLALDLDSVLNSRAIKTKKVLMSERQINGQSIEKGQSKPTILKRNRQPEKENERQSIELNSKSNIFRAKSKLILSQSGFKNLLESLRKNRSLAKQFKSQAPLTERLREKKIERANSPGEKPLPSQRSFYMQSKLPPLSRLLSAKSNKNDSESFRSQSQNLNEKFAFKFKTDQSIINITKANDISIINEGETAKKLLRKPKHLLNKVPFSPASQKDQRYCFEKTGCKKLKFEGPYFSRPEHLKNF